MDSYIGTKRVIAEPMTMGEVQAKGLLRPNNPVRDENAEGYFVEYADGYQSWSPKEQFESAYRKNGTALDRMSNERLDLACKCGDLVSFMKGGIFETLDTPSRALMESQLSAMSDYFVLQGIRMKQMEGEDVSLCDQPFSVALTLLECGYAIRRKGWNGKGLMVFKQIPAEINEEVIPKMQSLPAEAKRLILASTRHIDYTAQCLIFNSETGRADSWVPSIADVFATDWELVVD